MWSPEPNLFPSLFQSSGGLVKAQARKHTLVLEMTICYGPFVLHGTATFDRILAILSKTKLMNVQNVAKPIGPLKAKD